MKRKIFLILALLLMCSNFVFAKDKSKEKAKPPVQAQTAAQMQAAAQQEKQALIANINTLRNQELRVAVLQQLLNEESAKLRNVQEAFSNQYKLDVNKLRQGLYRYDDQQGKFVEVDASQIQR